MVETIGDGGVGAVNTFSLGEGRQETETLIAVSINPWRASFDAGQYCASEFPI